MFFMNGVYRFLVVFFFVARLFAPFQTVCAVIIQLNRVDLAGFLQAEERLTEEQLKKAQEREKKLDVRKQFLFWFSPHVPCTGATQTVGVRVPESKGAGTGALLNICHYNSVYLTGSSDMHTYSRCNPYCAEKRRRQ